MWKCTVKYTKGRLGSQRSPDPDPGLREFTRVHHRKTKKKPKTQHNESAPMKFRHGARPYLGAHPIHGDREREKVVWGVENERRQRELPSASASQKFLLNSL